MTKNRFNGSPRLIKRATKVTPGLPRGYPGVTRGRRPSVALGARRPWGARPSENMILIVSEMSPKEDRRNPQCPPKDPKRTYKRIHKNIKTTSAFYSFFVNEPQGHPREHQVRRKDPPRTTKDPQKDSPRTTKDPPPDHGYGLATAWPRPGRAI